MMLDDVIEIKVPDPDSQWRLRPCKCGNDPVYKHERYGMIKVDYWKVICPACGRQTQDFPVRHDAQLEWNGG